MQFKVGDKFRLSKPSAALLCVDFYRDLFEKKRVLTITDIEVFELRFRLYFKFRGSVQTFVYDNEIELVAKPLKTPEELEAMYE